MTAITYDGATPTVGADADTWGAELNIGALAKIKVDLDMLNTTEAETILGRVTAATGEVERLTGTQAATLLPPVVGASQSVAGTKGSVPAPAAGEQDQVLAGDGTFRTGLGRSFGCIVTTTGVNGSQPTLTGALNVASVSTLTVVSTTASFTITFTNALPSADYVVLTGGSGSLNATGGDHPISYQSKSTTQVTINSLAASGEISVSGF